MSNGNQWDRTKVWTKILAEFEFSRVFAIPPRLSQLLHGHILAIKAFSLWLDFSNKNLPNNGKNVKVNCNDSRVKSPPTF